MPNLAYHTLNVDDIGKISSIQPLHFQETEVLQVAIGAYCHFIAIFYIPTGKIKESSMLQKNVKDIPPLNLPDPLC